MVAYARTCLMHTHCRGSAMVNPPGGCNKPSSYALGCMTVSLCLRDTSTRGQPDSKELRRTTWNRCRFMMPRALAHVTWTNHGVFAVYIQARSLIDNEMSVQVNVDACTSTEIRVSVGTRTQFAAIYCNSLSCHQYSYISIYLRVCVYIYIYIYIYKCMIGMCEVCMMRMYVCIVHARAACRSLHACTYRREHGQEPAHRGVDTLNRRLID